MLEVRGPTLTLRYATADDAPALLELAVRPAGDALVLLGPVHDVAQPLAYIDGLEAKREAGELLDFLSSTRARAGRRDRAVGALARATAGPRSAPGSAARWWGAGVNRESKALIAALAFDHLGLNRLTAWANARNGRSQTALERVGFRREGVLRGWHVHASGVHDVVVFGLLRDDWERSPLRDVPVTVSGDAAGGVGGLVPARCSQLKPRTASTAPIAAHSASTSSATPCRPTPSPRTIAPDSPSIRCLSGRPWAMSLRNAGALSAS